MRKSLLIVCAILIVLLGTYMIQQFLTVQKAHSTFENYYAFRGCVKLLKKTDTYGLCQLADGKTIKLVNVNNKWYLDGDLPVCYFNKFCL